MSIVEEETSFVTEWHEWQRARWRAVSAPHGIASLADTAWLYPQEQAIPGVAGLWHADGDRVVGTGLADAGYLRADGGPVGAEVVLGAGETLTAGDRLLRAFVRDGAPALRVLDPHAEGRTALTGLDAYPPDAAWVVAARFTPSPEPLEVELVDGHRTVNERTGTLDFELGGVARRLTATVGADALSVVLADPSSGTDTYRFRFLRVALPDADGTTRIDFNRAFLPPCAFSPHYVCPLPPPGNRLDVVIAAGEKRALR